ncbi:fructose-bisphosphatase [Trifolium repens]|nr:fructose-bisphosphatase [Trifolium repens]
MNFALYMFYFSLFCFPLLSISAFPSNSLSNSAIPSLLSHPDPSLFFNALSPFIEALLCSSLFHCSSPRHCFTLLYSLRFLSVGCTSLLRPPPRPPTATGHNLLWLSWCCYALASEENYAPTWISDDGPYVIVIDPLDGSRNIDTSIPTGTIFGIYKRLEELNDLPTDEKTFLNSLQSGNRLIASGDFILTNPSIKIPPHVVFGSNCWSRAYILTLFVIDKDGANPDRVMQEDWGGDIPMVQISPFQGKNVDDLLETIMLVAKTHVQVPDWNQVFADPALPLMVDIGCVIFKVVIKDYLGKHRHNANSCELIYAAGSSLDGTSIKCQLWL